jgi:hypothetical protein
VPAWRLPFLSRIGSDIKSLKKNEERHDREIGVVYGHNKLQREVRG